MNLNTEQIGGESTAAMTDLAAQVPEALLHLKSAAQSDAPWYQTLLEAIGLWTLPWEVYQGRRYDYLIKGEALDWLVLAERLCAQMDGAIPPEAEELLLFHGVLPPEVTPETFREFIGPTKYRAYLNYWYGVTVEEALQLAVEEEVRKRHRAKGYPDSEDFNEEAFTNLYDESRTALLAEFHRETNTEPPTATDGDEPSCDLTLTELKSFTYWLFKLRFNRWDPARVASDTRKGIKRLQLLEDTSVTITSPHPILDEEVPPKRRSPDSRSR